MARKFLYFIAFLIVLVIAGAFVLNIWSKELTRLAFVPSGRFVEQSPLAALPCDPAVAGEWHSVGDEPSGDGEMILRVSADCQLEIEERTPAGPRTGDATPLFLGEHAGQRYAWTDAGWLLRRFGEDHVLPAGDVHLVRYAITGDRLELWSTDAARREKSIAPLFNRAVIFNTRSDTFHGHPAPLATPAGVWRRSIAMYYYTTTRPEDELREPHNTRYKGMHLD